VVGDDEQNCKGAQALNIQPTFTSPHDPGD
jgi:hypothetical protein